jgi:hypothetical protein
MNDKFTLRDFLVYFTTGTLTILSIDLLFFSEILSKTTDFFEKNKFISDFSGLLIVLAVPVTYFIGHLIHGLGFLSLKTYKLIHKKLTDWNLRKFKIIEWIRLILHFFMYKNKVIDSIMQENKKNKTWSTDEDFWIDCAKLQKDGKFGPAEYWYTLNDLFKGLYTAFLISSVIAFILCKTGQGLIFVGLFLICHFRTIQFADFFVKTVKRLAK